MAVVRGRSSGLPGFFRPGLAHPRTAATLIRVQAKVAASYLTEGVTPWSKLPRSTQVLQRRRPAQSPRHRLLPQSLRPGCAPFHSERQPELRRRPRPCGGFAALRGGDGAGLGGGAERAAAGSDAFGGDGEGGGGSGVGVCAATIA